MKTFLGILLCVPLIFFSGIRIYKSIIFNIECEGHLKRAADSNTIDLAKKELETALKYIKDNHLTEGYTSILYKTPNEDVGFWYQNLFQSLQELNKINDVTTQLEKSNILMKLRETLLDQGKEEININTPPGISIFPNNTIFAFLIFVSFLSMIIGFIMIGIDLDL